MTVRLRFVVLVLSLAFAALASDARAQQDDPVGPFVVDARVAFPSFSSAESIATTWGFRADQMPERGLGFELGAHVYPLRRRRVSLGVGASLMQGSGKKEPVLIEGSTTPSTEPTVESRISALTPQVSLNFGSSRGWSYLSAGYGWTRRSSGDADGTLPDGSRVTTLSYGGGARWFIKTHVAFSFDLRFYRLPATVADADGPASPGYTMFVASAGLSFK
jgi:hypothetical protein